VLARLEPEPVPTLAQIAEPRDPPVSIGRALADTLPAAVTPPGEMDSHAHGGLACGPTSETEACDNGPCPFDCQLGEWGEWSACSVSCGGGVQTRMRPILVPPQFGGTCGPTEEMQACNTQACPQP